MILNLRDRAYVDKFAREVGELKNETVKAGNAYMDLYQIAKHLKNIRSFQPNALEQAKDRPTSIKKNVNKLIFDVNAFSNMENKALGKAKALITLVKFIRILASD